MSFGSDADRVCEETLFVIFSFPSFVCEERGSERVMDLVCEWSLGSAMVVGFLVKLAKTGK